MVDEPNPAVVPEPESEVQEAKQYTVTGVQAVLGHRPGDTFTAKLSKEMETYYLEAGHLSLAVQEPQVEQSSEPQE